MIAEPRDYQSIRGEMILKGDMDVCVRQLSMQKPHKALAVTGAACAAVASAVPGSLLAEMVGNSKTLVRLGHPSGVLRVAANTEVINGELKIKSAQIERTARLLMDGFLYAKKSKVNEIAELLKG